jgi:hypothetical protein
MKCTLALLAVIALSVGCETQADRERQKDSQIRLQTAEQVALNDATEKVQAVQLEYVNNTQGEGAGSDLAECFGHGFDLPRRTNLDGQPRPMEGLSNRKIANCDHIMKMMQKQKARNDAEEKRKDAAYDKAHSQK